jgi:RNA polymerase sigma factor for flagellar operon FliA
MNRHDHDAWREEERTHTLTRLITALPEPEQLVLSLYYCEELTLAEIGRVLQLTEAQVSQLHTQAMHGLRDALHAVHAVCDPGRLSPHPE